MKLAYYPGCWLKGSAKELDMSMRTVSGPLGIELLEVPDWNCCGGSSAHSMGHFLAFALPARNIINAESTGCKEFTSPCPACYVRHFIARRDFNENMVMRQHLEKALGRKFKDSTIKIKNLIEVFLDRFGPADVRKSLTGLKVVNYYGCALVKPPGACGFFDDPENPQSLDKIAEICGAEPIEWPYKTECCGASLCFTNQEAVWKAGRDILQTARDSGAQAVVVACPMCQMNLDMRQAQINRKYKTNFHIPVIYFTQLIGLAMGYSPKELGIDKLCVSALPLLRSLHIA
ncbi:CoB--CoM heterodisulfide reductase iron-sulfur subunit B family protein [Thermincola ferriacetica]